MKIQSLNDLEAELLAVASGKKPAPIDAAEPSFESVEALLRLLTADNRQLMKIIRDQKPQSVAELARLSQRAEPNLLRTLAKLEAAGFVEMQSVERRKVPVALMGKLQVEIDPYGTADSVKMS